MPKYKYKAKDIDGKGKRGVIDVDDENALYTRLREEGLYLTSYKIDDAKDKMTKKLKAPVVADFCRQLGTLLSAGVSLVRALRIMANENGLQPIVKGIYEDIIELVRQGIPLSDAMEEQGRAFPPLLIHMMRSAEANGNIDRTALRMAVHFEKEHKLNGKVKSAMMYPMILSVILVGVVIFILTYLVPQFEEIFSTMETLPIPTVILLGFSNFVKTRWYIILIAVIAVIVGYRIALTSQGFCIKKDKIKLKMPIVGKLLRRIYTARFARTLCSLYTSGIPIIKALQVSSTTVGNAYIEDQFPAAIEKISRGETLSSSLQSIDGFQNKLAASIMIGEETGSLDDMLDSSADHLEYEAEQALERLVSLIEPVLIVLMAIIIGTVVVAVILPIYQSYSTIEQG